MTLIECFDRIPAENILGCLHLQPDTLIFLGRQEQMERTAYRYRDFFRRRGMPTQVLLHDLPSQDPAAAVRGLTELITRQGPCVIDVTGGQEHVLLAVGAVMATLSPQQRQMVRLQKLDVSSCTEQALSVEELIALHGGKVHPRAAQPAPDCSADDIEALWQLMCRDPKAWNRSTAVLAELESRGSGAQEVCIPLAALAGKVSDLPRKEATARRLLADLSRCGAINDQSRESALRYRYRTPLIRSCIEKAGNLLETKALLEARAANLDGQPFFQDCRMSVTIDWDGVLRSDPRCGPETRNEIDLILIRGTIPLFVSCKNGSIGEEELYKLNTVAMRFGSPYARKLLIATDLNQGSLRADQSFAQRARDMGIRLVENAACLDRHQWQALWPEAMER